MRKWRLLHKSFMVGQLVREGNAGRRKISEACGPHCSGLNIVNKCCLSYTQEVKVGATDIGQLGTGIEQTTLQRYVDEAQGSAKWLKAILYGFLLFQCLGICEMMHEVTILLNKVGVIVSFLTWQQE